MPLSFFFFFNDTATTEIYTLSLHDALPISRRSSGRRTAHEQGHRVLDERYGQKACGLQSSGMGIQQIHARSEEHTSELQSRLHLVCRLLLEKKKNNVCHIRHVDAYLDEQDV